MKIQNTRLASVVVVALIAAPLYFALCVNLPTVALALTVGVAAVVAVVRYGAAVATVIDHIIGELDTADAAAIELPTWFREPRLSDLTATNDAYWTRTGVVPAAPVAVPCLCDCDVVGYPATTDADCLAAVCYVEPADVVPTMTVDVRTDATQMSRMVALPTVAADATNVVETVVPVTKSRKPRNRKPAEVVIRAACSPIATPPAPTMYVRDGKGCCYRLAVDGEVGTHVRAASGSFYLPNDPALRLIG